MADNENKNVKPKKDSKINAFIQKHGKKKLIIGTCGVVAVIVLIVGLSVGLTTCNKGSGSTSSTSSSTTSVQTSSSNSSTATSSSTITNSQTSSSNSSSTSSSSGKLPEEGFTPVFSSDKSTCTYGIYPQTYVSDSSIIAALNEMDGPTTDYYYVYNNNIYAKVSKASTSSYTDLYFSDGTKIVDEQTYWFKCEPITWNVVKTESGLTTLISNVLLDGCIYNEDTSEPKYDVSNLRTWLNDTFYNKAFYGVSNINPTYIQTNEVDNSASTTNDESNQYCCDNTFDKVYLPSLVDMINNTVDKNCNITDYLKASGVFCTSNTTAQYWTRSPTPYSKGFIYIVDDDGSFVYLKTNNKIAVRPVITIYY